MEITVLVLLNLVLLGLIFWQGSLLLAIMTGVPIVYANRNAIRDSLKLAGLKKGDTYVDLGCGNGRTLIIAAREFGANAIGVDRSIYCVLKSRFNVARSGCKDKIKIIWGKFEDAEPYLAKADVVYIYWLIKIMEEYETWIFSKIADKTKIVSLAFEFVNHKPIAETETKNLGIMTGVRVYEK